MGRSRRFVLFLLNSLLKSPCSIANDLYRIRINLCIVGFVNVMMGITFFIETPLLHQYVTGSTANKSNIELGLGLSESWYSVIVSASNIGVFFGAMFYGLLSQYIYVKAGIILELLLQITGGLLYVFSSNGWLLFFSRLFNGLFIGFNQSLMRNYAVGVAENHLQPIDPVKRRLSTVKYTILFVMFCTTVSGMALGPLILVIGQYLPLSEFHWPGYYMCIHSSLLLILVCFVFNDKWNDITRSSDIVSASNKKPVIPHLILFVSVFLHVNLGWNMSIIETLQNPILSDQFGLGIASTSFVFIGVLTMFLISAVIVYVLQRLKFENRDILIGSILISTIGTVVMSDWQVLRGDPCDNYSSQTANVTLIDYNKDCAMEDFNGDKNHDCIIFNISTFCARNISDSCVCDALNDMFEYNCHWNPISRVTDEYCELCRDVCLSINRSLTFVQLFIGMLLLSSGYTPGRQLITAITSDIAGKAPQGWLMSVLVTTTALSRATGPLWSNFMYILVNRRTWLVMLVMLIVQLMSFGLIVLTYKMMAKPEILKQPVNNNEIEAQVLLIDENHIKNSENATKL